MPRLNRRQHEYTRKFTFYPTVSSDISTDVLLSETFEILDGTKWQLILYPKGRCFRNFTSLYLKKMSCDIDTDITFVDFSFECEMTHNYVEFQNICFLRNDCWGSPTFSRILHSGPQKTKVTFKILFGISKSKTLGEFDTRTPENDLEALSKDLLDFFMSGELFDHRLYCDGIEFMVHKPIITARCPRLASYIEQRPELTRVIMRSVSREVLNCILLYLYSAKLVLPKVQISTFYFIALQLEMTDLIQQMLYHPYFNRLNAEINVDHLDFVWIINTTLLDTQSFGRTKPTKKIYTNKLIMTCEIEKKNDKFCVSVSFNFDTFDTDRSIFLDFKIEMECDRVFQFGCGSHIFFSNEPWKSQIGTEMSGIPKELKLECQIDLCDNTKFISDDHTVEMPQNFCYYGRLATDMMQFLNSEFLSDFSIISKDGREFKVHGAILAARSPVFRRMMHHNVRETITGRIEIDDIDSATLQLMILYIYTGMTKRLDLRESIHLYAAADKYFIDSLKLKCVLYILFNIIPRNKLHALISPRSHKKT
ncbi:speckle-type POZ protein-like [Nephila pilipes]|uniref:Speckle-type POZ protein-like n=1 Tax=Nephila pilipes TaxID=299642 RepID=A0A8X6TR90_NEPPI|nr:speckle-type POZ protein-like [Nephila pilipes]